MGIIISILSYVTKIYAKVSAMLSGAYPVSRSAQSGEITLTGQEQTLYEKFDASNPFYFGGGSINLAPLQSSDVVIIKMYVSNSSSGLWSVAGQLRLTGWKITAAPVIEFSPMYNQYGIRVGMTQIVGTYRAIKHDWFDGIKLV